MNNVLNIIRDEIPTEQVGEVLRRLPAKYFDPELKLFRPITPVVLIALSLTAANEDDDTLDLAVANTIEVVAADPDPQAEAWTTLPGGRTLYISRLLTAAAGRIAELYAPQPSRSRRRSPAPAIAK